jgi:hypothetical protein
VNEPIDAFADMCLVCAWALEAHSSIVPANAASTSRSAQRPLARPSGNLRRGFALQPLRENRFLELNVAYSWHTRTVEPKADAGFEGMSLMGKSVSRSPG